MSWASKVLALRIQTLELLCSTTHDQDPVQPTACLHVSKTVVDKKPNNKHNQNTNTPKDHRRSRQRSSTVPRPVRLGKLSIVSPDGHRCSCQPPACSNCAKNMSNVHAVVLIVDHICKHTLAARNNQYADMVGKSPREREAISRPRSVFMCSEMGSNDYAATKITIVKGANPRAGGDGHTVAGLFYYSINYPCDAHKFVNHLCHSRFLRNTMSLVIDSHDSRQHRYVRRFR